MKIHYPDTLSALTGLIKDSSSLLLLGAQTGTVIPYEHLRGDPKFYQAEDLTLISVDRLSKKLEYNSRDQTVRISGPVTWADLAFYLGPYEREILVAPTETSAYVLSGIATSCTGERSFAFGPFRQHIEKIEYMNAFGERQILKASDPIQGITEDKLKAYQNSTFPYQGFKNPPYPYLDKAIDFLVGTEGQMGVLISAIIKTAPKREKKYLGIALPYWRDDFSLHHDIFLKVQNFRKQIYSVEFLDKNSLEGARDLVSIDTDKDLLLLEVETSSLEDIYNDFLLCLSGIDLAKIFELSNKQHQALRVHVPRLVQDKNSRQGIKKIGTDAQFSSDKFHETFYLYKKLADRAGCEFLLFGHFGDLHLHFNFLPNHEKYDYCLSLLREFYDEVKNLKGSPFTEHGVGLLKQSFISSFWEDVHYDVWRELKKYHDPDLKFFPQGHFSKLLREVR